jgi:hypothetical protein
MVFASGRHAAACRRTAGERCRIVAYKSMMRPTPTGDGLLPELHREHIEAFMTGQSTHPTPAIGSRSNRVSIENALINSLCSSQASSSGVTRTHRPSAEFPTTCDRGGQAAACRVCRPGSIVSVDVELLARTDTPVARAARTDSSMRSCSSVSAPSPASVFSATIRSTLDHGPVAVRRHASTRRRDYQHPVGVCGHIRSLPFISWFTSGRASRSISEQWSMWRAMRGRLLRLRGDQRCLTRATR